MKPTPEIAAHGRVADSGARLTCCTEYLYTLEMKRGAVVLLTALLGCSDRQVPTCTIDVQCDDGRFCSGAEVCAPDAPEADRRGCLRGRSPCGMGFGCDETSAQCVDCTEPDSDADGHESVACGGEDCDDGTPARSPGNTELCDGIDNDCDGMVDEGCAVDGGMGDGGAPDPQPVSVSPEVISFGNVVVGTSAQEVVAIANSNDHEVGVDLLLGPNVKRCEASGDATYCVDGTIDERDRIMVPARGMVEIQVRFTPAFAGARARGSFELASCEEPDCMLTVRLDGLGVETGFYCDQSSLDFGTVNLGACVTADVECRNVANAQIGVGGWSITSGAPVFEAEPARMLVLPPGDVLSIGVSFCPSGFTPAQGHLRITTDETNRPEVDVALEGAGGGPDIDVAPSSIDFGTGSLLAPVQRPLEIVNGGFAPLVVNRIVFDASGNGAFSTLVSTPFTLDIGEVEVVNVEFQGFTEGPIQSELRIESNDRDEPEVRVQLQGTAVNLPPCSFSVASSLDFGTVPRGDWRDLPVVIHNVGSAPCLLTSARLLPGSSLELSILSAPTSIPPSESGVIRLRYMPMSFSSASGNLEIGLSSPTSPISNVAISAAGFASGLTASAPRLDFGTVGSGCASGIRSIVLYNVQTGLDVTIDQAAVTAGAPFSIVNPPAWPVTLARGDTLPLSLQFNGAQEGEAAGILTVQPSMGPPLQLGMFGRVGSSGDNIERFVQVSSPEADVLFVVDPAASVEDERNEIAANVASFLALGDGNAIDYHVGITPGTDATGGPGVIVSASGNASDGVVTPQSQPTPGALFSMNMGAVMGFGPHEPLESAYFGLTRFGNALFWRPSAPTRVLFVSHRDDASPAPIDYYRAFFRARDIRVSAITGGTSGCTGSGGEAQPSPRLSELVRLTRGSMETICSADWPATLQSVSQDAFGYHSSFFLEHVPVAETISVDVDGVAVPPTATGGSTNWAYDPAVNAIDFSPLAKPVPGAIIEVAYATECL